MAVVAKVLNGEVANMTICYIDGPKQSEVTAV